MSLGMFDSATLDCQDCGAIVRRLSWDEAQKVANDPYAFIAFCHEHGKARMEEINNQRGATL